MVCGGLGLILVCGGLYGVLGFCGLVFGLWFGVC